MSTILRRPVWSVTVDDEHGDPLTLGAPVLTAKLDSGAVPYASARVTVPLIDPSTVEAIDPREPLRAVVELGTAGAAPRVLDLGVRERVVDHKARTIELRLAGDEALLLEYAPLVDDTTPLGLAASLRAVVSHVLATVIPGAALAPGPDADVTPAWALTNFNPRARVESTDGFYIGANVHSWGYGTDMAYVGSGHVWIRSAGAGESILYTPARTRVTAGSWWTASAKVRSDVAGNGMRIILHWLDSAGSIIGQSTGDTVTVPASPWVTVNVTGVAPVGAAEVLAIVIHIASGAVQVARVDAVTLTPGSVVVDPFSGASADSYYTYAWEGAADASVSTRTPLTPRDREALIWSAGVTAWGFLEPLLAASGLRLYCDEQRTWRMIDPATFTAPGLLSLSPLVSSTGSDTITRDDPDIFCEGVVATYRWTSPDGTPHIERDSAGSPGVVLVLEFDRPYPGPGLAAAVLARRTGQGRTQDVVALADWTASPGQAAQITLPGTLPQSGQVSSIEWELPAALMRVGTRGLTDVIPGTIDALTGTIDALTGTIDAL